ncbi:TOMM precursor leader peptide-binding protein [Kineococcus terrestris]|uniref:TOMM precursor leader peptide-binding protein n=1 Tax=Kineococcus terrestris TaxID=2044856 RepID=UPI0034DB7820
MPPTPAEQTVPPAPDPSVTDPSARPAVPAWAVVPLAVRPGGAVQVGSSPRSGTVVGPLAEADALALLDLARTGGTRSPRAAARRARELAAHLAAEGALPAVPEQERRAARAARGVAVVGAGRTGAGLAALLGAAGVGGVVVEDPGLVGPDDLAPGAHAAASLGRRRGAAAEEGARRWRADLAAGTEDPEGAARPAARSAGNAGVDLVVLVDHHAARAEAAAGCVADGVPHLSVVLRDSDAVVGPLVLPGRTACLLCLDLHRADADPGWPAVRDQLVRAPAATRREPVAAAGAVAGLAALQVLAHLDGARPTAVGSTLEVLLPEGLVQQRRWSPHPQCGCGDLPLAP